MNITHMYTVIMIPVRCFTCGKVIGDKYQRYIEGVKCASVADTLDSLGLKRYCCRRMMISEIAEDI